MTLALTKPKNLDSLKLKEFADDNFKFNENDWNFSKSLENTVKNSNDKFLLFSQCFKNTYTKHMWKARACFSTELNILWHI